MSYWSELDYNRPSYGSTEGTHVCLSCIVDTALQADLSEEPLEETCSYCNSKCGVEIRALLERVEEAIKNDYSDPNEELPYESAEGGWQGDVLDAYDVIEQLGHFTDSEQLYSDIVRAFSGTEWCRKDYFGYDEFEVLDYSYEDFCDVIKHENRFLFTLRPSPGEAFGADASLIDPGAMLKHIGDLLRNFAEIRTLDVGVILYRSRVVSRQQDRWTADGLGSPPNASARANRMSPAGISAFYACLDPESSITETFDPRMGTDRFIVTGSFEVRAPVRLLDLTKIHSMPSIFDRSKRGARDKIAFLRKFCKAISAPIERDDRVHIEYVPSQVITEFIRTAFVDSTGNNVDGLLFRSSKNSAANNVVLFLKHNEWNKVGTITSCRIQLTLREYSVRSGSSVAIR